MALEVRQFAVKCNAGTPQNAAVTTDLGMPARIVRAITVRVPPGPRGMVGFTIGAAGTQLIPLTAGEWIVADDEELTWELDGYITSGAWQITMYNNGQYNHEVQVRFELDLVTAPTAAVALAGPLAATAIEAAAPPVPSGGGLVTLPGVPPTLPVPTPLPLTTAPPTPSPAAWVPNTTVPGAPFELVYQSPIPGTMTPSPDGWVTDWSVEQNADPYYILTAPELPNYLVAVFSGDGSIGCFYPEGTALPVTLGSGADTAYLWRSGNPDMGTAMVYERFQPPQKGQHGYWQNGALTTAQALAEFHAEHSPASSAPPPPPVTFTPPPTPKPVTVPPTHHDHTGRRVFSVEPTMQQTTSRTGYRQ